MEERSEMASHQQPCKYFWNKIEFYCSLLSHCWNAKEDFWRWLVNLNAILEGSPQNFWTVHRKRVLLSSRSWGSSFFFTLKIVLFLKKFFSCPLNRVLAMKVAFTEKFKCQIWYVLRGLTFFILCRMRMLFVWRDESSLVCLEWRPMPLFFEIHFCLCHCIYPVLCDSL